MINPVRHALLCALLAVPMSAVAASAVPAIPPAAAAAPFDAAASWRDFLAARHPETLYDAFDLLADVGYDNSSVDATRCKAQRERLSAAIAQVPVSIALRHAGVLCDQATGDTIAATQQGEAMDALSALALSQALSRNAEFAPPIRVVSAQDAVTLVALTGMETAYEYYWALSPSRYMPFVKVVIDPTTQRERHLAFDVVDSANAVIRSDAQSGYPMLRTQLAEAFLDSESKSGLLRAVDAAALRAASLVDEPAAKVSSLRAAAGEGGVQSLLAWVIVCRTKPFKGCADGLVDGVLPAAEKRQAMPMTLLAYMYASGTGVERDERAAATLLDEADKRWPGAAASAYFVAICEIVPSSSTDSLLRTRKAIVVSEGNVETTLLLASEKANAGTALDGSERALLALPEYNARGLGLTMLAQDELRQERTAQAVDLTRRAAEAGSPWGREQLGWRLRFGHDVARDPKTAAMWLREAAHDGRAFAARILAGDAMGESKWIDAMQWLLAPASAADLDSLLDLAGLMASGRVGDDKVATGFDVYRKLAASGNAEARRRLAARAIDRKGTVAELAEAEAWLRADAGTGDHASEAMLGSAYLRGSFGRVEESEGRKWMDRAIAAKEDIAFADYASWMYYTKKTPAARKQALQVWGNGVKAGSQMSANNLAWALCTSPSNAIRQPVDGLAASGRMGDIDDLGPGLLDTVAACHAANGDFERAVSLQRKVVERFNTAAAGVSPKDSDADELLATSKRAAARLALYEAGRPYLEADRE